MFTYVEEKNHNVLHFIMRSFERSYRLGCCNETIIKITLNYNSIEGHIQVIRHEEDGETSD